MATLTPVDNDPFAAPPQPKLTPIDHDPFANSAPSSGAAAAAPGGQSAQASQGWTDYLLQHLRQGTYWDPNTPRNSHQHSFLGQAGGCILGRL